jgi:hypothetical protein
MQPKRQIGFRAHIGIDLSWRNFLEGPTWSFFWVEDPTLHTTMLKELELPALEHHLSINGRSNSDQSFIRGRAKVGAETVVGRGSTVDNDVIIGERVRIQTDVYVTSKSVIEDDVPRLTLLLLFRGGSGRCINVARA